MQELQQTVNGQPLFYRLRGEGPLVVLLHGFGEDGNVWKEQFNTFDGFRLLIPDLPGSGRSASTADMSIDGLADIVHQLLSSLQVDRCTVIGHSMGGYITLALAEKYPGLLNGFGLFHSTSFADSDEKKETRKKAIDFIRRNGAFEFLSTSIPNLYSPVTKETRPELIQEQLAASHGFTGEALIAYYEAMIQRPDRTEVLRQAAVPVLFVMGRHDTAVPMADGLQQCHLPSLSQVNILDNSGHMGMLEEVEESNRLLKDFLELTGRVV